MDWERGNVQFSNQNAALSEEASRRSPDFAKTSFGEFIKNYRERNCFIYRDQLIQNFKRNELFCRVDMEHLNNYNPELLDVLKSNPSLYLEPLEQSLVEVLSSEQGIPDPPPIQLLFESSQKSVSLRSLSAELLNRLLKVSGIVISASRTRPKATSIHIRCRSCQHTENLPCAAAFGSVPLPRTCRSEPVPGKPNCGLDPYVIVPDLNRYEDQQSLKLQESPEAVPTGEIPRHVLLFADRSLVDFVPPGTRVDVIGVFSIFKSTQGASKDSDALRTPYIRVLGMHVDSNAAGRIDASFSTEDVELFHQMRRDENLYTKLYQSIAPSIQGEYTTDMKKAICCLLFGGSRKQLPDGIKLRGDVNVLFLGDPSTAKSQFLKFVERVAPVGVYTSGKGSSAAGLTASVIRDSSGEFYLEGGAMILADGGVVCIDEFDKMKEIDRVAIHEAMEQQTISIAKAGITTILNSRTSVLAAANPVFGHYDESKTASENIDFLPTILSRFDMVFIVRDVRSEESDRTMAHHVIQVHMRASSEPSREGVFDTQTLKKYISYCRQRCAPRLSQAASDLLVSNYVNIREGVRSRAELDGLTSAVPITVRQLEAIVRIAESIAKMHLRPEATSEDVQEAIRLFKASTLNAASSGVLMGDSLSQEMRSQVQRAEESLRRRISVGSKVSVDKLISELESIGHNPYALRRALQILVQRGDFQHRDQRRNVVKLR